MNSLPVEYARLIDATHVAERLHLPKARERHKWACPCCGSSDALHVYPGPGRGSSCYSCGESPDAIGLVMRAGGLKFMDAIRWLAGEFGFSDLLDEKSTASTLDAKRRLKEVQAQIAEREKERVRLEVERRASARDVWDRMWPMLTLGLEGWEYMAGRGIPHEVAAHCGIRSVETEAAWKNIREQFTAPELEDAGLLGRNDRGAYPVPWRVPFLVIPYWLEESGVDILRFRDLSGEAPKYLSPLGHRPTTAYLDHTGHILSDDYDTLFVCEGEINALSVLYAGAPAIGASGSATWQPGWSKGFRWYQSVVVLADGDKAGRAFSKSVYDATCLALGRDWADKYLKTRIFADGVDANDALVSGQLKEIVCG